MRVFILGVNVQSLTDSDSFIILSYIFAIFLAEASLYNLSTTESELYIDERSLEC